MPDDLVSVRYIVDDVDAAIDFYTEHFGFTVLTNPAPAFADVVREETAADVERLRAAGLTFRNDIVSGPGGRQILIDDPSGNPIELFQPAGA